MCLDSHIIWERLEGLDYLFIVRWNVKKSVNLISIKSKYKYIIIIQKVIFFCIYLLPIHFQLLFTNSQNEGKQTY